MQPGHADIYEDLKVTFIFGRNPELTIRDDSGVVETIDLSHLKTQEIHHLLRQKGFKTKTSTESTEHVTLRE